MACPDTLAVPHSPSASNPTPSQQPQDLADSKRINANVKSVPNNATPLRRRRSLVDIAPLSATIVSQLFWPALQQEEFALPPEASWAGVVCGC